VDVRSDARLKMGQIRPHPAQTGVASREGRERGGSHSLPLARSRSLTLSLALPPYSLPAMDAPYTARTATGPPSTSRPAMQAWGGGGDGGDGGGAKQPHHRLSPADRASDSGCWGGEPGACAAAPAAPGGTARLGAAATPSWFETPALKRARPDSGGGCGSDHHHSLLATPHLLASLASEVAALRSRNASLRSDLAAAHEDAAGAAGEARVLGALLARVAPHKARLALQPPAHPPGAPGRPPPSPPCPGAASCGGACGGAGVACVRGDGYPVLLAPGGGPAAAAALVQAEAVAAAALAVNGGNPAAALVDLLTLAVRRMHDA